MGDEDLDAMLQRIVELLEAHGEKWNDSLLIGEPVSYTHLDVYKRQVLSSANLFSLDRSAASCL